MVLHFFITSFIVHHFVDKSYSYKTLTMLFLDSQEKGVSLARPFSKTLTDTFKVIRKTTSYSDFLMGFATQPGILMYLLDATITTAELPIPNFNLLRNNRTRYGGDCCIYVFILV